MDGVDDQIKEHLLQLSPVSLNGRHSLRKMRLHRDAVFHCFSTRELNHFTDCIVDLHPLCPWRRPLYEITNPANDIARPAAIRNDPVEQVSRLLNVRWLLSQISQRHLGVDDHGGDRLVDFMGDRSRELPHGVDAVRVRQLHLNLAVSPFALTCYGFHLLASSQVEHERNALVASSLEACRADQHGRAAAVLAEVFFLPWLRSAGHFHLLNRLSVAVAPFRRRQVRPAHPTGHKVIAAVSHYAEKRVIGLNDRTFEIIDKDAYDVGVDQATHSRLPSLKFDEKFDEAYRYGNHREQNDQPAEVAMKNLHDLHCLVHPS